MKLALRSCRSLALAGLGCLTLLVACRHRQLPRPISGAQGPRPPGAPCDFEADYPPPAAQIEVIGSSPLPDDADCVWVDGHWRWEGRRWSWSAGGWARAPSGCHYAGAVIFWMPGGTDHGKLCMLYPSFFSDRSGARCAAEPCVRPGPAAPEGAPPPTAATEPRR